MRIFITGGTGYIGSAVVVELRGAEHGVTALNRSPDKADRLRRLGAEPLPGDLSEPEGWEEAAAAHDVLIHCGFDPESSPAETDRTAVEALLRAARAGAEAGEPRAVVYTSGCWVLGETDGVADESAPTDHPAEVVAWRPEHERLVLEASGQDGVTGAVVRPGIVYGGGGGLTAALFESAEREGAADYVGTGENHWSLVHRRDLARLYRRAAERGADGVLHGVDGRPVPVLHVARAASDAVGTGGAARGVPLEKARERLGPVADALCLDQRLVARRSQDLGWRPRLPSFLDAAEQAYRELLASRR